jgi:hypothetical protein
VILLIHLFIMVLGRPSTFFLIFVNLTRPNQTKTGNIIHVISNSSNKENALEAKLQSLTRKTIWHNHKFGVDRKRVVK